jgi:hypothetical protein
MVLGASRPADGFFQLDSELDERHKCSCALATP